MQRLFSMFPKGAPGIALLLLRLALGIAFLDERWAALEGRDPDWTLIAAGILAVFIWAGALTPVACALCALAEAGSWAMSGMTWQHMHLCSFLVAIALGLLGPGAYALDGRAFGRRKVIFPPSDRDDQ